MKRDKKKFLVEEGGGCTINIGGMDTPGLIIGAGTYQKYWGGQLYNIIYIAYQGAWGSIISYKLKVSKIKFFLSFLKK